MNELIYKINNPNSKEIEELEKLRCEIIKIDKSNYYLDLLLNGKIIGIGCYYNNQLIGGAYISDFLNSIYIEQLFVKEEYQNNALHIGSSILKYILENKKIFSEYYNKNFDTCRLESKNRDSLYSKLGFKKEGNIMGTMKKRL